MHVKYTGTADFRELGSADFKKFGVEGGRKTTFARNEPTEVDDSLWPALEKIGEFEQVQQDEAPAETPASTDEDVNLDARPQTTDTTAAAAQAPSTQSSATTR